MMKLTTFCIIINLSFLGVPAPVTHHPEISSYLSNGTYVYINEPVTVTCQTRDSQAHAWQSTELFGKGSNIAFTSDQTAGSVHHIGRDIEVILVSVDTISGELIIRSQIQFTVNSSYNDLITITCLNIDFGTSSSITFHITDMMATEISGPRMICPRSNNLKFTCTARDSFHILWLVGNYTTGGVYLRFLCIPDDGYYHNELLIIGNNITVNISSNVSHDNGIFTLTCNLEISQDGYSELPQFGRNPSVTCVNLDFGIEATHNFSISENYCDDPDNGPGNYVDTSHSITFTRYVRVYLYVVLAILWIFVRVFN